MSAVESRKARTTCKGDQGILGYDDKGIQGSEMFAPEGFNWVRVQTKEMGRANTSDGRSGYRVSGTRKREGGVPLQV